MVVIIKIRVKWTTLFPKKKTKKEWANLFSNVSFLMLVWSLNMFLLIDLVNNITSQRYTYLVSVCNFNSRTPHLFSVSLLVHVKCGLENSWAFGSDCRFQGNGHSWKVINILLTRLATSLWLGKLIIYLLQEEWLWRRVLFVEWPKIGVLKDAKLGQIWTNKWPIFAVFFVIFIRLFSAVEWRKSVANFTQ